jgi:poly(3-hydroxybutyrate) depolymerase
MAMNPLHHFRSHWDFYTHLVEGDLDGAEEHRRFYDEYNAVLDMPGEYYLDCVRVVFHEHLLPRSLPLLLRYDWRCLHRGPFRLLLA